MAGRPLTYKTVQELQAAVDAYFDNCKGEIMKNEEGMPVFDKKGELVRVNQKVPTVTGLALALGFASRQALLNYQGKKQFHDAVTRAKSMVEEYAETRLFDRDGARGAEFSLKCNFKWNENASEAENEKSLVADAEKVIASVRKLAQKHSEEEKPN